MIIVKTIQHNMDGLYTMYISNALRAMCAFCYGEWGTETDRKRAKERANAKSKRKKMNRNLKRIFLKIFNLSICFYHLLYN